MGYNLIHIIVFVSAKPACEVDILGLVCEFFVLIVNILIFLSRDWIVRVAFCSRKFVDYRGLVVHLACQMFELGNSGVQIGRRIIDSAGLLIIALVQRFKLDPSKIESSGRGENFPIADNGNFQGRQLNRRVEFTIYRK